MLHIEISVKAKTFESGNIQLLKNLVFELTISCVAGAEDFLDE